MGTRNVPEAFALLADTLRQILIIIENNDWETPFSGLAELTNQVEEIADELECRRPIYFDYSSRDVKVIRVVLNYPYGDETHMFRVDQFVTDLVDPNRARQFLRSQMETARRRAISVLRVWLGLIPIWIERESPVGKLPLDVSPAKEKKLKKGLQFISEKGHVKGVRVAREIGVEESTFRKHYVPDLKKLGVQSGEDGYFIPNTPDDE